MCGLAGRRGRGQWSGWACLECAEKRIERGRLAAKASKTEPFGLRCAPLFSSGDEVGTTLRRRSQSLRRLSPLSFLPLLKFRRHNAPAAAHRAHSLGHQLATATTSAGYSALFQRPDGRVGVLWETEGDVPGCRGQGCSIAVSFL